MILLYPQLAAPDDPSLGGVRGQVNADLIVDRGRLWHHPCCRPYPEREEVGPGGSPGAGRRRRECKTEPRPRNPRSSNAPHYKFGAASSRMIPAPDSQDPRQQRVTGRLDRRASSSSARPRRWLMGSCWSGPSEWGRTAGTPRRRAGDRTSAAGPQRDVTQRPGRGWVRADRQARLGDFRGGVLSFMSRCPNCWLYTGNLSETKERATVVLVNACPWSWPYFTRSGEGLLGTGGNKVGLFATCPEILNPFWPNSSECKQEIYRNKMQLNKLSSWGF